MLENQLSRSAQTVQNALLTAGLDFKVVELADSTRTANDAAQTIGCDVAQIVKSLIFKTANTHKPILILASGINRVNEKLIEQVVGEKLLKADADFAREVTGFAIGGIPPVGHKQHIDTFIDEDLLQHKTLWAAAGTPHAVFSLDSAKLVALTNGQVLAVKVN